LSSNPAWSAAIAIFTMASFRPPALDRTISRADEGSAPSRSHKVGPEHRLAFTLLILAHLRAARYCTKVQ